MQSCDINNCDQGYYYTFNHNGTIKMDEHGQYVLEYRLSETEPWPYVLKTEYIRPVELILPKPVQRSFFCKYNSQHIPLPMIQIVKENLDMRLKKTNTSSRVI